MDNKQKIKCTVSYDGSAYAGYQVQANGVTVQGVLEEVLERVTKEKTTIHASGRTDAGVHARGQVIHFSTSCMIPLEKWPLALNALLPGDIVVRDAALVPESFHARFDVVEKTYRYCIWNERIPNVFLRNYSWHIPHPPLDIDAMREGAVYLKGEHDFTSFCSIKSPVEDKVRTLYGVTIERDRLGEIWITLRGSGFLYNMVRIIAGTLVDVGTGKFLPDDVGRILRERDRLQAGKTAPAHGLFLWEVKY